jgi:hypothetical protein
MTYLQSRINRFIRQHNEKVKPILEAIINKMLKTCEYTNNQSLERHNWGEKPIKLKYIPKDITAKDFNTQLIRALDCNENQKSIIELLWGDVQLGKRIQACIIMWFSVYILQRPVIYIFRNLDIDRSQLQNDIIGTDEWSFNIQYIYNIMKVFNTLLQENLSTDVDEYWNKFKLPELKDLRIPDNINRISNKNSIGPSDIFCGLMNVSTLKKLKKKLSEYILHNQELANFTLLIDEGDLVTPTASNDSSSSRDDTDSTQYEQLVATISKMVIYSCKISGTVHSLLYNYTTLIEDSDDKICTPISKVHKMKRVSDYFGIMNSKIVFKTDLVNTWWKYEAPNPNPKGKKKTIIKKETYSLTRDYLENIKRIIQFIIDRNTNHYNSLLISEEKIRNFQLDLVHNYILKDFSHLFLIVYHGQCLQLYFDKQYIDELNQVAIKDSKKHSDGRLRQNGGIYKKPFSSYRDNKNEVVQLPNNYCYYEVDSTKFNIKMIYKLLKMLFTESTIPIKYKTAITITGKYGERGYSFTSDDYGKYSFHLTDQYLVSHATFNCTDIVQRIRLQGKYNDVELKNGKMQLTLWTTKELQDVIQTFYVNFINSIEKWIMTCNNHEEIAELIENLLDNGNRRYGKCMNYLDVAKKRKNLKVNRLYDSKMKGYKLLPYENMSDKEISTWCKESDLPVYNCINEIKEDLYKEFLEKYYVYENAIPIAIHKSHLPIYKIGKDYNRDEITKFILNLYPHLSNYKLNRVIKITKGNPESDRYEGFENAIKQNTIYSHYITERKPMTYNVLFYPDSDYENIHISIMTNNKILAQNHNTIINNMSYSVYEDKVFYSKWEGEPDTLPDNYYWKSPNGWLYLHMKSKPDMYSISITRPRVDDISETSSETTEQTTETNVAEFASKCCSNTTNSKLRFGIAEIYNIYKEWCTKNNKISLGRKTFKEDFEKLDYKEAASKGVNIDGDSGKRGYNIMVELK